MKEFLGRIFKKHDYLSENSVEDPQIASLVRIAEGSARGPIRKREEYPELLRQEIEKYRRESLPFSWKGNEKRFSDLANQLYAIEQLGKSANNQALDYLTTLSEEDVQVVRKETGTTWYSDTSFYNDSWREEQHSYPNTKGALKHFLDFQIQISTSYMGFEKEETPEGVERQWARVRRSPARQILNKAISTLEQDLSNPPR